MRKAFAVILALSAATPALAQDDRDISQDFNGPYFGAAGGYSMQSNDRSDSVIFDTNRDGDFGGPVNTALGANAFSPGFCGGFSTSATPNGCARDSNGAEYWARAGYDRRMGNFVVGAVIEGGKSEVRDSTTAFSTTPASYTFTREMEWSAAARLRAGYTPGGGALFYVTGGGAYAKMDHGFRTTNTANSFTDNGEDDAWGWQAGGGAEIMVAQNVSIGMEYLYSRFDDHKWAIDVGPGTAPATNPFLLVNSSGTLMKPSDNRFDYHSVRGTVNFRF